MKQFLTLILSLFILAGYSQTNTYPTWTNPSGNYATINSGQGIKRTAGSGYSYDAGQVTSVQQVTSGGSVTFQLSSLAAEYVGLTSTTPQGKALGDDNDNGTWVGSDASVKYGVIIGLYGGSDVQAFEAGTNAGTQQSMSITNWIRITYTGSVIAYQKSTNGTTFTTFYTSAVAASGAYYVVYQAVALNAQLDAIYITSGSTGNVSPTVNAGSDQSITLPTSTATLTATASDADGTISSYAWTKVSGPTGGTISAASSASTGLTALAQGIYVYNVLVTDNSGATASDQVSVVVSAAPTSGGGAVSAGPDQYLGSGVTSTTLTGSTYSDTAVDLIILFGESNASGRAPNSAATAYERTARPSVRILNNNSRVFEPLDLDQNNSIDVCGFTTEHGMEVGLANAVEAGRLKNPTYLVKSACSGTRIDQWLNGSGQPSWNEMRSKVDAALAQLTAQGITKRRITVWMSIGLNDAVQGTPADSFYARINRFTAAFRAAYGATIKFHMTQFHRYRPDFGETAPTGNGHPYNAIIDLINANDPNLTTVETTDAGWITGEEAIHWSANGFKVIADRMVTNTLANQGSFTYAWSQVSGPSTASIVSPTALTTVVNNLTTPGEYKFRFTINDGGLLTFDEASVFNNGSTIPYAPTIIPFSDPDIISPYRGAENWSNSDASQQVAHPTEAGGVVQPLDVYQRSFLEWDRLESSQGVYTWAAFDNLVNDAISKRQRFGFGIMTQNPFRTDCPFAGGAYMSYPLYVHNLMQAETANSRDWISAEDAFWIPNYNSNNYLSRFEALLNALAAHINNTSFNGVRYQDVVSYVDIRGYGSWGEWNMVFAASTPAAYPTGRQPLASSLIRIIDAHRTAFPNTQLMGMIAAFDGQQLPNTWVPDEVGYHMLTATNNRGKIGWRRDQWGWTDGYISSYLENNPNSYNGLDFDTTIMNRWKYAPIMGEGPCGGTATGGPCPFWAIPAQVRLYHASMIGNGNFCGEEDVSVRGRDSMRLAWKTMGYRMQINSGATTASFAKGAPVTISLNWQNVGIAPVYEDWVVRYELQDQTSGVIAWTGNSSHILRLFQPSVAATVVNDNFVIPTSIPSGTYRLVVKIVDPTGYRDPFPLAIQGRRSDGSYQIRQDIIISAGGQNIAPTVNAGVDQTIQLPTNSVSVTATGNDVDGTIASYAWSKVSGGNAVITSASNATTTITGLVAGTYVFRNTVTDNNGLTATDDVIVTVNAAANVAPTVNAGADRAITLPTNNLTVSASAVDTDGTIASYLWVKVTGTGGSITTPNSATTNISGLAAGSYSYRVTVTDNGGLTASDTMVIVVSPQANLAPTANAGTDSATTLPKSTSTLIGSGADSDGSITAYLWSKISGPSGGTITSPTSSSTGITGLIAGLYTYRLTVTDNSGATAADFVNVTVSPAPVGTAYVSSVNKTWGVETPTPRLRVRIAYSDGTTQTISGRNGAYVQGVRARYKFLEGGNRLVVIINYSDNTVQEIYKR
jgi:hypothetical protein